MLQSSEKVNRPTRDQIYMEVAETFAKRSTCNRKAVGACLIRDNHILGTGYNGAPRDQDECTSVGCLIVAEHCVRTVHAEVNAVLSAAYNGVSTKGATLYSTAKPCFRCELFLMNAGVDLVYYKEDYDDGLNNKFTNIKKVTELT
jgi:dCMP deaminase